MPALRRIPQVWATSAKKAPIYQYDVTLQRLLQARCGCKPPPPVQCYPTSGPFDGGYSTTNAPCIVDGGNAGTNASNSLDGGLSGGTASYDGGGAGTAGAFTYDGGGSGTVGSPTLDGGP